MFYGSLDQSKINFKEHMSVLDCLVKFNYSLEKSRGAIASCFLQFGDLSEHEVLPEGWRTFRIEFKDWRERHLNVVGDVDMEAFKRDFYLWLCKLFPVRGQEDYL